MNASTSPTSCPYAKVSVEQLQGPVRFWGYHLARTALIAVVKGLFNYHLSGQENLKPWLQKSLATTTKPAVITANHTSLWDPPYVAVACGWVNIAFMAKQELFDRPGWLGRFLGWFLFTLSAFAVNRHRVEKATLGSVKTILTSHPWQLLKNNKPAGNVWCLGMFPEGTRQKHELQETPQPPEASLKENPQPKPELKQGAAVFAHRYGAAVIPVGLCRSGPKLKRVDVVICPPVYPKPDEALDSFSERVTEAILAAKQAAQAQSSLL